LTASQSNLADEYTISVRQQQIDNQYGNLLDLGRQRKEKLEESCKAYQLVREAGELAQWIADKVLTRLTTELGFIRSYCKSVCVSCLNNNDYINTVLTEL